MPERPKPNFGAQLITRRLQVQVLSPQPDDVWSIFWNFYLHSKVGHTLIFCTRKEHSLYAWLCFVLCNTCFPPVPASNFRYWSATAVHCKKRCTPGVTQSNLSCWHSDNDASPLPSGLRKRIPWERCHMERLEQKKIALLDN